MRRFLLGNLVAVGLFSVRMLLLAMAVALQYLSGAPRRSARAGAA